ncbi:Isochorismatase hydrolase [Thozetella sp. PMI_491]|nr:Isochorismatase hydrolase [Thozetella sp. PMI_491]
MDPTQQASPPTSGFGSQWAVLNLDLTSLLIDNIKEHPAGQALIANCVCWNDAIHQKLPRPLTIFTTLSFSDSTRLQLTKGSPFAKLIEAYGTFEEGSAEVQIASSFKVDDKDIILHKTRWYAGAGNTLEEILRENNIDTVILSGLTLSGVVMSTVYRLFDLDYNIYVISDTVMELPLDDHAEFSTLLLGTLLRKMNLNVISLDQALQMLQVS